MSTNINFDKKLGISGGTSISLPSSTPSFQNEYSFQFDGIDEYFTGVTNYSDLDGQTKATFSLWVKPRLNQTGILFHIPRNTSLAQGQVLCYIDNNYRVRWSIDTTTYYGNSKINVINLNQWNHILFCLDFTQAVAQDKNRVFINGVDETAVNNLSTITQFSTSTGSLLIGEEALGYQAPFLGKIDEFAIWSGTDLRNDAATIYNNGVPNNLNDLSTPPTMWHRMGDNATWNGSIWTMTDVNGGYISNSSNMVEANRTTDVSFSTKSIQLDGVLGYVDCGDNDNLSFGNGVTDSPFSISTWLQIGNNKSRGVVSKYGSNGAEYLFYMVAGKVRFLLNDTVNSSNIFATGTTVLTLNTWYHVGITYDGNGLSGIKMYINRFEDSITTSGSGYVAMSNTNQPLEIGKYSTLELLGKVDEVAIFNSELSQSEITAIYGIGTPTSLSSYASLVSWWRFEGTGATEIDSGTGGNDGTLINGVTRITDVPTIPFSAKSIALDGVLDYINFSQITYTGEFTTSFWIKPDALGASFLVGRQANSDYVWLRTVAQIRIRINFSTYIFSEGSGNNINTGAWNHLLISRDSSNNVSIFLNGASFGTSQVGAGDHRLDQIGKVGTSYYVGNVDETAFWDSDQSSNLASIYNGGVPNDIGSLLPTLWYRTGDIDTAPTLTDRGSGGNNGTMNNFTTFSTDVPT